MGKRGFIIAVSMALVLIGLYSIGRAKLGYSVPDEKRYLQSTKEMEASGDYLTPRYHGNLRFQKPILFYWLIILSYKVFGVGIFGARFPSIIAAVMLVLATYFFVRDVFGNRKAAFFSAVVLATCEIFFMYARFAVPDAAFSLFIALAVYFFMAAYLGRIKGRLRYLPVYAFMALAMLTKGPLGFIYPALTIFIFIAVRRDWAAAKGMNIIPGLFMFAVISAPWFIAMFILHGNDYMSNVWSLEIVKKLDPSPAGAVGKAALHYIASALYYSGMIFLRCLPWSLFLGAAVFSLHSRRMPRSEEAECGRQIMISWFLAVFAVITAIWSRESYYILPLTAPAAVFIGGYLADLTGENRLYQSALFRIPFITVIAACSVVFPLWLFMGFYIFDKPIISPSLLMLLLPAGMLFAYSLRDKIKALLPASFSAATVVCFAYFAASVLPAVTEDPLERFAGEIRMVMKDGDLIGADGANYHRLNVYLDTSKVINIWRPPESELANNEKDPLNLFLSRKDVRVFCVLTKREYEMFATAPVKNEARILYKALNWKRIDKQKWGYFRDVVRDLLRNKRDDVKAALKEEMYLVSNR